MKCLSLPGITKAWYIQRNYLPDDVVYRSVAGIPVTLQEQPISINLKGEAICEVEQSFDNNSYIEKSKLTFLTLDDVPLAQHPAFVIETVDDNALFYGSSVKKVTFGNVVKEIPENWFNGCEQLESVTLSSATVSIGNNAFDGCKKLPTLELPEGLTTIGVQALQNCAGLRTLVIPNTLSTLGANALAGCSNVTLGARRTWRGGHRPDQGMGQQGRQGQTLQQHGQVQLQ